ncbi:MAG: methyltransferase [Candidatus Thorarchaeota archaeon]|nr:methyltransferase [Candidatus Thorarchaeota archaeon]
MARAELESLLNLFPCDVETRWLNRVVILESHISPIEFLLERSALIQKAGVVLIEYNSNQWSKDMTPSDGWENYLTAGDEFAVRTLCIEGATNSTRERDRIEWDLGASIKNRTNARVNLKNPAKEILVILGPENILICESQNSKLRHLLRQREPGKKMFFHPSMMNSTLSRVMCNLAGVMPDDIVLDPFCGGGGILCEASYIGARPIGCDLNWKMLTGAKRNLDQIKGEYSLIQADAQNIPVQSVDCIVTDPPYGRASSTRGGESIELVSTLMSTASSILTSRGEHLCICGSSEMGLLEIAQKQGLAVGKHLRIRVHSGLVRELVTIVI